MRTAHFKKRSNVHIIRFVYSFILYSQYDVKQNIKIQCTPLVIHIFGGIFLEDAQLLVLSIIMIAVNFYFVQNFSGRYLVGMRWWTVSSRESSSSSIRYEVTKVYDFFLCYLVILQNPERYSKSENRFFFLFLILPFAFWVLFSLFSILNFNIRSLIVCVMGVSLSGINLRSYYMASKSIIDWN